MRKDPMGGDGGEAEGREGEELLSMGLALINVDGGEEPWESHGWRRGGSKTVCGGTQCGGTQCVGTKEREEQRNGEELSSAGPALITVDDSEEPWESRG